MVMVTLKLQRYFVIYKRSPLKMQKIIKPRSPNGQLLETVNFAFINFFDFLVKIAVFKKRDALKTAILTKKSKIFIKAKLTVSKSCLLELFGFMIFCILRGDLL